MSVKTLTQEHLKTLFKYNEVTGEFTYLKGTRITPIGTVIGKKQEMPRTYYYHRVAINGKAYPLHRLAFLYMTGSMPDRIDHKNLNTTDNSWENLRECSAMQNAQNSVKYQNNTSGIKGVYWHKRLNAWTACIRVNKVLKHLGVFNEKREAVKAITIARNYYHQEFACHDS